MLESRTLRKRREDLGLTRQQLAQQAGIDATTILRIERGQDPRLNTWRKIEFALKQSAAERGGSQPH